MSADWISSLTAVISAVIGGAIAALLAPFVAWQIEKKKLRLESRRALISESRAYFRDAHDKQEIIESEVYSRLRPFLRPSLVQAIESETILIQTGGRGAGANQFGSKLLDEIGRLERDWDLI